MIHLTYEVTEPHIIQFCENGRLQHYISKVVRNENTWNQLRQNEAFRQFEIKMKQQNKRTVDSVKKEISFQLPIQIKNYLDQNIKMKEILDCHAQKLTTILEETSRNILNNIVNDPQYHEINKRYFDNFDKKCNIRLNNQQNDYNLFKTKIKNEIDVDILELKDRLNLLDEQDKKIKSLDKKINMLSGAFLGTFVIGISYGVIKLLEN